MNYDDASNRIHPGWVPIRASGWLDEGHGLAIDGLDACLTQLCRALQPLHEQNQLYGLISPDHVFVDPQGAVQIDAQRAVSMDARAESDDLHAGLASGFAAFEQYVDDPAWPRGPWTDICGMCALARALILKQAVPDAVQRLVSDTCEPLQDMDLPGYPREWLAVIDQGMSLLPQLRFDSVDSFAERLGLPLAPTDPPVVADIAAAAAGQSKTTKAPVWMIGLVAVVLIALGGWLLQGESDSTSVAAVTPAPAPATTPELDTLPEPEPEPVPEPVSVSEPEPVPAPAPDNAVSDVEPAAPMIDLAAYTTAQETLAAAEPVPVDVEPDPADAKPAPQPDQTTAAPTGADIRVQLSIMPWGEVFIDGTSRGVSPPLRSLSLKPGEYRVRVVNGDLPPHQQTLTVQAGESASIAHNFQPDE